MQGARLRFDTPQCEGTTLGVSAGGHICDKDALFSHHICLARYHLAAEVLVSVPSSVSVGRVSVLTISYTISVVLGASASVCVRRSGIYINQYISYLRRCGCVFAART